MQTLRLFYKEKDLVISTTRYPKLISQVPENVTVVTAREIEAMNAHTVAEVLNRIPGLFIEFNQDFGSASLITIQGSEQRHVLVMVDGIPWNLVSEGSAETNSIPVGIIERIEIIKGPASSAWGSSLGGMINILTKPAGKSTRPKGVVRASLGERSSRDYSAQISGLAGPVGYYLYAGRQESDGLRFSREFSSISFFSKFSISLSRDVDLGLTAGFSKPENNFGDFPSQDLRILLDTRSFFMSASFDAALTRKLDISLRAHTLKQEYHQRTDTLGLGILSPTKELFTDNTFDERVMGASGKLIWASGMHTAVLGIDTSRGILEQNQQTGPFLQAFNVPAESAAEPAITRWSFFANDTIAFNRWSITAGIRYDDNSIVGSFVSPSLGLTCSLGDNTLARIAVARGFTQPPLSWTSGGGLFLDPNPALKHETIWSYQAGLESTSIPYLWLKGSAFYHDLNDEIVRVRGGAGPPTFNDLFINKGSIRRQGLELEGETIPFHNLSVAAGLSYVSTKTSNGTQDRDSYTYNIRLTYDDSKYFQAQLFGHYIWWDKHGDGTFQVESSDFIWDLNLAAKILETRQYAAKLFLTARNLLNGDQYTFVDNRNPQRWVEAGINIAF